jgi:hypothetical protein
LARNARAPGERNNLPRSVNYSVIPDAFSGSAIGGNLLVGLSPLALSLLYPYRKENSPSGIVTKNMDKTIAPGG